MSVDSPGDLLKPVWIQIEELVANIHGWTPIDQLFTLYTIALATSELQGDILEVGSWCGRSAVVLAKAAKASGNSKVHCIDLFPEKDDWKVNSDETYSLSVTVDGQTYGGYEEQTVWKDTFESQTGKIYETYNSVFDCFQETVKSRNMTDVVSPHRGDLASFLEKRGPGFKCRLAFLDGDHGYEAISNDIRNIEKHIVPGGWLCFDDAFTSYSGVDRAISEFIIGNPDYERQQQMTRKLFIARKKLS